MAVAIRFFPQNILIRENCRSVIVRNSHFTGGRQFLTHAADMRVGIFDRGAMARINGKLHHREAVVEQVLAEARVGRCARRGVSVGRSNMAMTHMLRHPQGRSGARWVCAMRQSWVAGVRGRARAAGPRAGREFFCRRGARGRAKRRSLATPAAAAIFAIADVDRLVEDRQQRGADGSLVELQSLGASRESAV